MFDGIGPTDNRNHARQICARHACPPRFSLANRWIFLSRGGCWGPLDHAMVKLLDDAVENVTTAMRAESMWDQTLFVMCESLHPSLPAQPDNRSTDERAQLTEPVWAGSDNGGAFACGPRL